MWYLNEVIVCSNCHTLYSWDSRVFGSQVNVYNHVIPPSCSYPKKWTLPEQKLIKVKCHKWKIWPLVKFNILQWPNSVMENVGNYVMWELIRFTISRQIYLQLTLAFWWESESEPEKWVLCFWHRGRREEEDRTSLITTISVGCELFDPILFWQGMIHFPRRWRILPALISDGLTIRGSGLVTSAREETNFKGWHKWITVFVMQSQKQRNMALNREHSSEYLFIQR